MFNFKLNHRKDLKLGLALGGGGARGLAHIGFLKILDDLEIKPAMISGTSMGALIGAMYCSGMTGNDIEAFYKSISIIELGRLLDLAIPAVHGLAKGDRIKKLLEKEIGLTTFEELQIPLKIVATDYWNKKEIVLNHGNLVKAVRSSISVPGILEPVQHLNKTLTDGGAVNPVPYDVIKDDCNLLAAIDVTGRQIPGSKDDEIPNIFECIMNSFHIMETALIENKLSHSKPDFLYQPDIVNISIIDFTRYDEIMKDSDSEFKRFKTDMLNYKGTEH